MVATRMVCDRLSVETPSRAASSARGRMRSSGRSSEVSEITLAMIGIRFIWVASSLATLLTMLLSTAGHDQRDRAQAVFVEEPEADIRNVFELLADRRVRAARWVILRSVFGV